MTEYAPVLSLADVAELAIDRSPERRGAVAQKVAAALDSGPTARARDLATEILRRFAADEAESVRQAVARALAGSPHLPAELARNLARDADAVAIPVLRDSPVLSDADLIAALRRASPGKAEAVAARSRVSETVCAAVVATAHEQAIVGLMRNPFAAVAESTLAGIVRRYGRDTAVSRALIERPGLPPAICAAIMDLVRDYVGKYVTDPRATPFASAPDARQGVPPAALRPVAPAPPPPHPSLRPVVPPGETAYGYARKLAFAGTIEDDAILRALCTGELVFAESALALRAELQPASVAQLLFGGNRELRRGLLARAGIRELDVELFEAVLEVGNIPDQAVYQHIAVEAAARAAQGRSGLWAKARRRLGVERAA